MPSSLVYVWATIGVVLIIADLMTLTFFLFFLGLGALITALCVLTHVTPGIQGQLVCFAASSLIMMLLFRPAVKKMFGKRGDGKEYSQLVGQKARVSTAIPAGHEGKVSYRGSDWIAFSEGGEDIPEGTLVTIEGVEGIKLKVGRIK